ncbi:MAG: ribbon-helix-helix protein, CopG family [Chloroflexi bacterium]|nr:ribbon-helix-helix protein, CopG family [Chloroflexota bacterium]
MNEYESMELGSDVTEAFRAKGQRGTVVLSVRLSTTEMSRLEQAAQLTRRSISQLVREALTHLATDVSTSPNYRLQVSRGDVVVTVGGVTASNPVEGITRSWDKAPITT